MRPSTQYPGRSPVKPTGDQGVWVNNSHFPDQYEPFPYRAGINRMDVIFIELTETFDPITSRASSVKPWRATWLIGDNYWSLSASFLFSKICFFLESFLTLPNYSVANPITVATKLIMRSRCHKSTVPGLQLFAAANVRIVRRDSPTSY